MKLSTKAAVFKRVSLLIEWAKHVDWEARPPWSLFGAPVYTHDLPVTAARKFVYVDDLAIMHSAEGWQSLERTLTQDMTTLLMYLRKWKLKLSTTKTVTAAFHLYSKEATRELKVAAEVRILPFSAEPTYSISALSW